MGIIRQVENGGLDFGLVGMTSDSVRTGFYPFLEDELVIVTPVSPHYLELSKENVSLDNLLNEPLSSAKRDPVLKRPLTSILISSGFHPVLSMLLPV